MNSTHPQNSLPNVLIVSQRPHHLDSVSRLELGMANHTRVSRPLDQKLLLVAQDRAQSVLHSDHCDEISTAQLSVSSRSHNQLYPQPATSCDLLQHADCHNRGLERAGETYDASDTGNVRYSGCWSSHASRPASHLHM